MTKAYLLCFSVLSNSANICLYVYVLEPMPFLFEAGINEFPPIFTHKTANSR